MVIPASSRAQALPDLTERTEYPESLALVNSVRELQDGRILVADPLGQVVLRIDMTRGVADTLGRVGAGPREYRQPDRVIALPGDSTLLVDLGNGRLAVVAPDGQFGNTMPIVTSAPTAGGGVSTLLPRFADYSGALYYEPLVGVPGSTSGDSVPLFRFARASGRRTSVAMLKVRDSSRENASRGGGVATIIRPVPLSPTDDWAVGWDGAVVVVRSGDYHVEWIRQDGSVLVGAPVPYTAVRVGRDEKEAWIQNEAVGGLNFNFNNNNGRTDVRFSRGRSGGRSADPSSFDWPAVMPPFVAGRTLVSPRGQAWVERSVAADAAPVVDLFDTQARWLGSITLPPGRHVVGFGPGTVYLVRKDDLGLTWIERFRVTYPG
jgi:hypothetical protein